jgi:hypothetical protein
MKVLAERNNGVATGAAAGVKQYSKLVMEGNNMVLINKAWKRSERKIEIPSELIEGIEIKSFEDLMHLISSRMIDWRLCIFRRSNLSYYRSLLA